MRSLASNVHLSVIRAVKVSLLMHYFGAALASDAGTVRVTAKDYRRSVAVPIIHDFISHSWKTERRQKFLAVCWLYNAPAASALSWLAALAVLVMQSDALALLPRSLQYPAKHGGELHHDAYSFVALILCPCIFLVVGMFWQDMRNPRLVFMDKFCIHQTDPELKRAGIEGITGILKHSEQLVVLWTSSYFTRLWCSYELASWIHLGKSQIRFVPVCFTTTAFLFILAFFSETLAMVVYEQLTGFLPIWFTASSWAMISLVSSIFIQRHAWELGNLGSQLSEFSVERAECFCCSAGHKNPLTNKAMLCDRRLVYKALQGWFDRSHEALQLSSITDLSHLHFFDKKVRGTMKKHLLATGSYRMQYRDALILSSPLVWYYVPRAAYLEHLPLFEKARWALFITTIVGIAFPFTIQLVIMVSGCMERFVGRRSDSWTHKGLCIFMTSLCLSTFLLAWMAAAFPLFFCKEYLWQALTSSLLGLLAVIIFQF